MLLRIWSVLKKGGLYSYRVTLPTIASPSVNDDFYHRGSSTFEKAQTNGLLLGTKTKLATIRLSERIEFRLTNPLLAILNKASLRWFSICCWVFSKVLWDSSLKELSLSLACKNLLFPSFQVSENDHSLLHLVSKIGVYSWISKFTITIFWQNWTSFLHHQFLIASWNYSWILS